MISYKPVYPFTLFLLWAVFGSSPTAMAERSPIYQAADDYRDAVREFERQVLRSRGVSSAVKRLVDDLEDSTSGLKSAALDPARYDRLAGRMIATDALHARVELTFFGDPLRLPAPEIQQAWIPVYECYGELVNQMLYLQQVRAAKRGRHIPIVDHGYAPAGYPSYPTAAPAPVVSRYSVPPPRSVATPRVPLQSGATFDRFGDSILAPSRQVITTPEELRSAVIDSMLPPQ